jgi:hypothetical protein
MPPVFALKYVLLQPRVWNVPQTQDGSAVSTIDKQLAEAWLSEYVTRDAMLQSYVGMMLYLIYLFTFV